MTDVPTSSIDIIGKIMHGEGCTNADKHTDSAYSI